MIFYESPVRLVKTLEDFILHFGKERRCSVSRELSKMFEENKRGTLLEVASYFKEKTVKGEIVIVVAGKS
jgi:16S rRNA (cytidine1402-2'-O)-methyltransferase